MTRCRAIRNRLVAFQDGELSPGEEVRVREHLAGCDACAVLEKRLAEVTPRPFVKMDPAVEAAMWARLEAALDEAWQAEQASPAPRPGRIERGWWWLTEEMRVPTGAMLAYGALLAMAVAWGASNWWSAQQLQVALERQAAPDQFVLPAEIPTDQFRPAAWVPEEPSEKPETER